MSESFLEQVWQHREEVIYPRLFGSTGENIYPIPASLFSDVFQQSPDPRWLHIGVFACPPHGSRRHWLYVSSGLSNPWELEHPPEDANCPSWLGVEYIFETSQPGDWAIQLLHHVLAFELLLSHSRYPDRGPLAEGDRIPLHGPVRPGTDSRLTWLLISQPPTHSEPVQLDSGRFWFQQVVGTTQSEAGMAREQGLPILLAQLREHEA